MQLSAIFKLEFYKNQKDWKLSRDGTERRTNPSPSPNTTDKQDETYGVGEESLNPKFDGDPVSPDNKVSLHDDETPEPQLTDIDPLVPKVLDLPEPEVRDLHGPEVCDITGPEVLDLPGLEALDLFGSEVFDLPGPEVRDLHGPQVRDLHGPEVRELHGPEVFEFTGLEGLDITGPEVLDLPGLDALDLFGSEVFDLPEPEVRALHGPEVRDLHGPEVRDLHGPEVRDLHGPQVLDFPGSEIFELTSLEGLDITGPEVLDLPGLEALDLFGSEVFDLPGPEVLDLPGPKVFDLPGLEVLDLPGPEVLNLPGPESPNHKLYRLHPRSGQTNSGDRAETLGQDTQLLASQLYWQNQCGMKTAEILEELVCDQYDGHGQHYLEASDAGSPHHDWLQQGYSLYKDKFTSLYDEDQGLPELEIQVFDPLMPPLTEAMSCSIEVPTEVMSELMDDTADFMRGAHLALHSSEIDLNTTEECPCFSEKKPWALSMKQLARDIQRHEHALALLLQEGARRGQLSTRSVPYTQFPFDWGDTNRLRPPDGIQPGGHCAPSGPGVTGRGRGRLQQARKQYTDAIY